MVDVPGATQVVIAIQHQDVLEAVTQQLDGGTHAAEAGADDDGLVLGGDSQRLDLGAGGGGSRHGTLLGRAPGRDGQVSEAAAAPRPGLTRQTDGACREANPPMSPPHVPSPGFSPAFCPRIG